MSLIWPAAHVQQLVRAAERDTDAVSMFTAGDRPDCSVVVLKGRDVVRCFREWAERNRLLTPGKDVEG